MRGGERNVALGNAGRSETRLYWMEVGGGLVTGRLGVPLTWNQGRGSLADTLSESN
jgi:hypothetical protein